MKRILLVGIPAEVGPWLESRLPGVKAETASLDADLAGLVQRGDYALLLLDHGTAAPHGYAFIESASQAGQVLPPVFYSLPSLGDFALLFRLVQELKVQRLLVHPLEPEELLGRLSEFLQVAKAAPRPPAQPRPPLSASMEKLWNKHLPGLKERARRIAQADGLDDNTQRTEIQRCAHQLAGTVGSFGLQAATELARQAEGLLITDGPRADLARLRELGSQILAMLDPDEVEPTVVSTPSAVEDPSVSTWDERLGLLQRAVLTLTQGGLPEGQLRQAREEIQRLRTIASIFRWTSVAQSAREVEEILLTAGIGMESAGALAERVHNLRLEIERSGVGEAVRTGKTVLLSDAPGARWKDLELTLHLHGFASRRLSYQQLLKACDGQAAVLEFDPQSRDITFRIVESLQERQVPCLVYADQATLADKVRLTSLGVCGLLEAETPAAEVLALVREALEAPREPRGRILVVDDDPLLLKMVERMLTTAGFQVVVEQEPLLFWERVQEFAPDLVLLDVDMPRLSGIELCRVLRQDANWGGLPAIFLTVERDAQMVERMFAAGADDYVLKPLVGGDLIGRIDLRLTRFQRGWNAILSGRQGDQKAAQLRLEWFLQLSNRVHQPLTLIMVEAPETPTPGQELPVIERLLREASQAGDVVLRWGGHALMWVLFATGRVDARDRLDAALRIPARVASVSFPSDGAQLGELLSSLQKSMQQASARSGYGQGLVALIDDDATVVDLVRGILEPQGMSVRCFETCAQARQALIEEKIGPRVVLLDVNLPDGNGYGLLQELVDAGVTTNARVVMLTGEANASQRVFQAIEQGAFDYISKPFQAWVLAARVRRAWAGGSEANSGARPAGV